MKRALYAISARRIVGGDQSGTITSITDEYGFTTYDAQTQHGKPVQISKKVADELLEPELSIYAEIQAHIESFAVPVDFEIREREYPIRCWPYRKHRPEFISDCLYELGDSASVPKAVHYRNPVYEPLVLKAVED